jgi:diguanylate cyclase (GGDEF)-like protein
VSAHQTSRAVTAARVDTTPSTLHRAWPFRLGGAYVVLAAVLLASSLSSATFAAFPPTGDTPRVLDAWLAALCLLLAACTLLLAPKVENTWGLDICIAVTATFAAAATADMPRAQGQLLVGFGLVLLGVYTAYYRPLRRLVAHLVWCLSLYAAALVIDRHLPSVLYFGVVAGTVAGLSMLVAVLAERLRTLAFRDPLTGLLNRHGFDVAIAPLVATSMRSGRPLTVGVIDLDGFKAYNDAYGHFAGDDLLVEIASSWEVTLRTTDLLARFGGDEFVLVLPGATPEEARELEARLREQHPMGWSIGYAQWQDDMSVQDALTTADAALYTEKRTRGRRRGAHTPHPPLIDLSVDGGEQRRMVARDQRIG